MNIGFKWITAAWGIDISHCLSQFLAPPLSQREVGGDFRYSDRSGEQGRGITQAGAPRIEAMNIVPLRFLTLISTLFLVLLVTGCATTSLESDVAPGINTASWHTFYVQKLPADERGIEKIISEQLTSMGYDSTYGANSEPPDAVDAIVTYQDRWMWDITMYMIDLQIQFRDPATDVVLASGHSFRTSLARKSPEEMVKEVLDEIFPGSEPGMDKNTP